MLKGGLSVFFPAYNEEGNIKDTVEKAVGVLEKIKVGSWEILVINDGSKDRTKDVVEKLSRKYPKVRVVNQPNGGYGAALRSGFKNSKFEWICYTDGDGQFDFSEVAKFLDEEDTADLLLGYRIKRKDPWYRILFAKGWAMSLFIFFGLKFKDIDCGFKMVRRKVIDQVSPLESSRGAMINAELVIKSKRAGFRIKEIGVNHYPRLHGSSTGASLRVIVKSYLDLIKMRLRYL